MAAKAGAQFFPIPIRQDDIADHFADAIQQAETLCVNGHGVAKFLLSRAVRQTGYKVVLTGEGSDEMLGGYLHFRRDMLARNGKGQEQEIAGSLQYKSQNLGPRLPISLPVNGYGRSLEGIGRLLGFVPGWIDTSSSQSIKMHAVLAQGFLEAFKGQESFRSFFNDIDVQGQLAGRHPLNQSLYLWTKTEVAELPSHTPG
jgi:asparagine synthase (glutamine-hydrolysing)